MSRLRVDQCFYEISVTRSRTIIFMSVPHLNHWIIISKFSLKCTAGSTFSMLSSAPNEIVINYWTKLRSFERHNWHVTLLNCFCGGFVVTIIIIVVKYYWMLCSKCVSVMHSYNVHNRTKPAVKLDAYLYILQCSQQPSVHSTFLCSLFELFIHHLLRLTFDRDLLCILIMSYIECWFCSQIILSHL